MSKLAIFVSATIVLIFQFPMARANPQNVVPEVKAADKSPGEDGMIDENLSVTEPAPVSAGAKAASPPRYYSHRQQLTFRAGQVSEVSKIKFEDFLLGFQYLFPKFLSPKLEAGADLLKDGKGHLHAGLRWIWFERSYFRPSYKLSIDHLAESEQRLATLTQINNYFGRLTLTAEVVFWNPWSLRLEPEIVANLSETQLLLTLGLSRGW